MAKFPSMPVWKKILFGILTIAVFFVGSELALRLIGIKPLSVTEDPFVGFAGNIPLFVERVQPDGAIMLVTAKNKLRLFNEQQFPKVKSTNSYRIFCMGGSTTYGHPFVDSTSFCGWLREFLPAADPSKNWEVINAGGISYASYRVANLMNELSQYQPDLFIVYSGQNEFLEERTYRTIIHMPEWVIRTKAALTNTRTYTVMNRVLESVSKNRAETGKKSHEMTVEVDEILDHTVGPTSYTRDEALRSEIITHYKFNLERMIAIAKSAGSKIIFITPASNLKDMPPFKSENRASMTDTDKKVWNSLYEQGKKRQEDGMATEALTIFTEAIKIDNRYADLHFRVGQVLFALRRFDESKISFQKAIDEDICPLRILSPMSNTVHEIAKESNVPLIDFVKLIEDDCYHRYGHKIPGDEYFIDHLHPTIDGYRMLGLALLDQLAREGIARTGPLWNDEAIAAVTRKVEQRSNTSEMRITYLRNLARTINWTGRFDEAERLLLRALHGEKEDKNKGLIYDYLARLSFERKKIDKAIDYWYKALPFWPDNNKIRSTLAGLLQKNGRLEDALSQNYEILRIFNDRKQNPGSGDLAVYDPISVEDIVNAHSNIAHIFSIQGRTKKAMAQYAEVLKLKPDEVSAHTNMGVLLAKEGQATEAIIHFVAALKINPDSSMAHYNLGMIFDKQGKLDEAVTHYSEALRIEPGHAEAHNNLGVVFARLGEMDKAVSQFSYALKVNPGNAEAHYNLGMAFAIQGRKEESDFHFSEAKKINAVSAVPHAQVPPVGR
jgi:tetratricopeptide (TPR) repeat protein